VSYVGGKHAIRREVADIIERECHRLRTREVVEPFCGGLHVTAELGHRGISVHASDKSVPAVRYYQALRLGWRPKPATISRSQWQAMKDAHRSGEVHPMISFAGFSCSMNGIYFTAFDPDPVKQQSRYTNTRKRVMASRFLSLRARDYASEEIQPRSVVYADPPYAGTDVSAYRSLPTGERTIDHAAFWQWARATAAAGSTVLVSEYTAPDDIECVWHRPVSVRAKQHTGEAGEAVERVFRIRGPE